jgi:hypothetical protein
MVEKFILTPQGQEIVINQGSIDGAIDLFSYGPDIEPAARTLGSLYVLGWRQADTNTMGYMVSLIAALARREYYSQPSQAPKEAFARTLRKINEVVDEFFKSAGIDLAVGIFAVAGGTIMVSKLDKFKILLAREGQVIDILNNVMLFTKEHLEKRRFSSIISGSIQAGDRLLAYYPARSIVARERMLKGWLLGEEGPAFATRLQQLGQEQPAFAASFLHIDLVQTAEPIIEEEQKELPPQQNAALAWSPRQQSDTQPPTPPLTIDTEQEVPQLIPSEFSLGTRQSKLSRWMNRLQVIRLNGRGKAIILAGVSLVIVGGVLAAKSLLFVSAENKKLTQTIQSIQDEVAQAQQKAHDAPAEARAILVRALSSLTAAVDTEKDHAAKQLAATITAALDGLDNAQPAQTSIIAQLDPDTDPIALAVWSSSSHALWAVTGAEASLAVVRIGEDGLINDRTTLTDIHPDILVGHQDGILVIDATSHTIARVHNGTVTSHTIPTQEHILDAAVFADALYLLTDHSILKISDLDTQKPVTKQWLSSQEELSAGAARIWVDGNVYTLDRKGTLATYYKGKKVGEVLIPLESSGSWRLVPATPEGLAVASADRQRVYVFDLETGALDRTLTVDSQQPLRAMAEGPNGSVIAVTQDNRIWKVQ